MKGHTIQFVLTRVRYIQDSLYEGICTGFSKIQGGQSYDYFKILYLIRNPEKVLSLFEVA